ncbi:alpha/beta hydrolase domain-containing protein [Sulfurospirillum arsenophilum]|uniref:alpha/beta hydrolase domain-containing protein n=1 Tax=Sulfurospirillum arsenophilum TaxID=56698 RepID=UPI0005A7F095|nr:alpha/beta hydrolase domain-containing protein [Sulfurospirillum arsenophilum]
MKIPVKKTNIMHWILFSMLALIMTGCAGNMKNMGLEENSKPTVLIPPAIATPMSATAMPLNNYDYEEKEYFIQGKASRYRIKDKMKDAQFIDSGYPYTTRILVRKPNNPAKFNGTVIIEWLNVSLDQDVDFVFGATRELVVREGYAWIGISAQRHGVEAMKKWNPKRYDALNVAVSNIDPVDGSEIDPADPQIMAVGADVLAWDIFSQIGQMASSSAPEIMGNLKVKKVIAAAESQSTLKVSTYYNSIQPLHHVYDGFLFYDRSGLLRTDIDAKTIAIGTEIFTALMGYPSQEDTDHQRWWEVNGASHFSLDEVENYVDPFMKRDGAFRDAHGKALNLSEITAKNGPCTPATIYSRVPNGDIMKAALKSLNRWISGGKAPKNAPRFIVDAQNKYVRDVNGQVLGGIRTAAQDAPIATNAGIGQGPWFCGPSGNHVDFTKQEFCKRYGNHDNFVSRVKAVVNANVHDGFLLPEEAQKTINEAESLNFSCIN